VKSARPVVADARGFLDAMLSLPASEPAEVPEWMETIRELREHWPDERELEPCTGPNPNKLMHTLSLATRDAAAYVVDVGANQMWACQSLELADEQRFLTSGGLGSMGFALPAAIGAALAAPGRPVVMISGDGGMQINLQELETVARCGLPVKMLVLNNQSLGMVRQFQEMYMDGRYQSTVWGYGAPDFERVASAYGIAAWTACGDESIDKLLPEWWQTDGPALLQVMLDTRTGIAPKMLFGSPMTRMHPELPLPGGEDA
jgi:acetolactate synthase-1/2/3 large subunit